MTAAVIALCLATAVAAVLIGRAIERTAWYREREFDERLRDELDEE